MKKNIQAPDDGASTVQETVAVYRRAKPAAGYRREKTVAAAMSASRPEWNPNVPFHGTQDEWWEHFHQIEQGPFQPVSEVHRRVAKWLDQKK